MSYGLIMHIIKQSEPQRFATEIDLSNSGTAASERFSKMAPCGLANSYLNFTGQKNGGAVTFHVGWLRLHLS